MARFFIDEKNDDLMIYKAKVIGNAYNPISQNETIISSTLDGGYERYNKVINYYYNISGLTMIISKTCDNDKSEESFDLKIIDDHDVVFNTQHGFSVYGIWDNIFNNAFKEAQKQIKAFNSLDEFTITEHNSKEKVKELKKEN